MHEKVQTKEHKTRQHLVEEVLSAVVFGNGGFRVRVTRQIEAVKQCGLVVRAIVLSLFAPIARRQQPGGDGFDGRKNLAPFAGYRSQNLGTRGCMLLRELVAERAQAASLLFTRLQKCRDALGFFAASRRLLGHKRLHGLELLLDRLQIPLVVLVVLLQRLSVSGSRGDQCLEVNQALLQRRELGPPRYDLAAHDGEVLLDGVLAKGWT